MLQPKSFKEKKRGKKVETAIYSTRVENKNQKPISNEKNITIDKDEPLESSYQQLLTTPVKIVCSNSPVDIYCLE